MRTSVIIIGLNEGERLWKTVRSCIMHSPDGEHEIIVVDDASLDDSVAQVGQRFPQVKIVRHTRRRGAAQARNSGAAAARGSTLILLDAHCHPEPGALTRLANDVDATAGDAIIAPRIAVLDADSWTNSSTTCGNGYELDLLTAVERYVPLYTLRRRGRFYESPNMVGCCFAISRQLFDSLGGLDEALYPWGSDTVEFGLRAWLAGHCVLNDIEAVIGHRFHGEFVDFDVPDANVLANQIRTARKHFTDPVWDAWLPPFQGSKDPLLWSKAWQVFQLGRERLEQERVLRLATRPRDEFAYALHFDRSWPLPFAGDDRRAMLLSDAGRRYARVPPRPHARGDATCPMGSITFSVQIGRRQWGDFDVESVGYVATNPALTRAAALLAQRIDGRTVRYAGELLARNSGTESHPWSDVELASSTACSALGEALRSLPLGEEGGVLTTVIGSQRD